MLARIGGFLVIWLLIGMMILVYRQEVITLPGLMLGPLNLFSVNVNTKSGLPALGESRTSAGPTGRTAPSASITEGPWSSMPGSTRLHLAAA